MAKATQLKPEETLARAFADRLILTQLTELTAAVKLSEIAERLQGTGIGLAAIRALLASNPAKFAYSERRWIPAARVEGVGRPYQEAVRLVVHHFGGPMPLQLLAREISLLREEEESKTLPIIERVVDGDGDLFFTNKREVALRSWVFSAGDETIERAFALHGLSAEEVDVVRQKLGDFDWRRTNAIAEALKKCAPVSAKVLGAVAWLALNPQDPLGTLLYDWREFNAELLATEGYAFGADGLLTKTEDTKKWITTAVRIAEKMAPSIDIEDAAPIEVKAEDIDRMAAKIQVSEESVTATQILEEFYEITPSVKTFPDDLKNVMEALKARNDVWWVGGDRFRKPDSAPEFIYTVPELFQYEKTDFRDEDDELIDVELTDEGLSSSLRKLLSHPLATDVLDEEIMPAPKGMAEQLRLVLKPIHRELGTFPMCQIPTGWLDPKPTIQELIFMDPEGRELQVWANTEARLLFNLLDWFYEQPVESGAVFSLTRTARANVFEFAWLDQTDPVVFITSQRMEELRAIQANAEEMSTLELLQEVMSHWPKGADFLTILWELNVVRRTPRRLVASLLSSYLCFYQRSGSPVWHFDSKKVDQGFDKTKRKFVKK